MSSYDDAYERSRRHLRSLIEWGDRGEPYVFVDLHDSGLVGELPPELAQLSFITNLELRYLSLTSLPTFLRDFKRLRWLDIGENPGLVVPEWLGDLTSLETLHMHSSNHKELPKCLVRLENLTTLTISNNNFRTLPKWLLEMKSLKNLRGYQNPWNRDFKKYFDHYSTGEFADLDGLKDYLSSLPR